MSEKYYDEVIAPALKEIAEKCLSNGMSMVAVVEYEPGERGRTRVMQTDAGLEMTMINHCAKTAPNVDGYVLGLVRYANERGIPLGGSLVMRQMAAQQQKEGK